jgi:hypothetical protein
MVSFLLLRRTDAHFDYANELFRSLLTSDITENIARDLSHLFNVLPHIRREDPSSVICIL